MSVTIAAEYRVLHKYLKERYAEVVVLTFSQIEDLLGAALPLLARTESRWWTDPADGAASVQSSWIQASRTATPNLFARSVRFERVPG